MNARSGGGHAGTHAAITAACARHSLDARVVDCAGGGLAEETRRILDAPARPDIVIAAGGDGTVSTVANVLALTAMPLGIIPIGTFNHFSRDLRIPINIDDAVALIVRQLAISVDLAEVNGRRFVNNSSIGIYPALVMERNRNFDALPRWLANTLSALRALLHLRIVGLTLEFGRGPYRVRTPLLFVGNNAYPTDLRSLFRRSTLLGGRLVVHIVRRDRWWTIFGLLLRLLFGRTDEHDIETHACTTLRISTHFRRRLRVSVDGEVYRLRTPLHYRILPAALRVVAPPAGGVS